MYNVKKVYENDLHDDEVKNYSQLQISKPDIFRLASLGYLSYKSPKSNLTVFFDIITDQVERQKEQIIGDDVDC